MWRVAEGEGNEGGSKEERRRVQHVGKACSFPQKCLCTRPDPHHLALIQKVPSKGGPRSGHSPQHRCPMQSVAFQSAILLDPLDRPGQFPCGDRAIPPTRRPRTSSAPAEESFYSNTADPPCLLPCTTSVWSDPLHLLHSLLRSSDVDITLVGSTSLP